MQVIAELNQDSYFGFRAVPGAAHREAAGLGAEEAQTLDEITAERHRWGPCARLEFAEGNMDGPLVRSRGAQTVIGEIDALADAHAGRAEQEEDISARSLRRMNSCWRS